MRVLELTKDVDVLNNQRLELEIALIAERLDITEEIVRLRSHLKFFVEAMESPEAAGRKLNFILQEMNRVLRVGGTTVVMVYHRSWWNYYVFNALLKGVMQGSLRKGR